MHRILYYGASFYRFGSGGGWEWNGKPVERQSAGNVGQRYSGKAKGSCVRSIRTTARTVMRTCTPLSAWKCGSLMTGQSAWGPNDYTRERKRGKRQ